MHIISAVFSLYSQQIAPLGYQYGLGKLSKMELHEILCRKVVIYLILNFQRFKINKNNDCFFFLI